MTVVGIYLLLLARDKILLIRVLNRLPTDFPDFYVGTVNFRHMGVQVSRFWILYLSGLSAPQNYELIV